MPFASASSWLTFAWQGGQSPEALWDEAQGIASLGRGAFEGPGGEVAKRERFGTPSHLGSHRSESRAASDPVAHRRPRRRDRRVWSSGEKMAPGCGCKRGGCDSLFANSASWRPEMWTSKWARGTPNSLPRRQSENWLTRVVYSGGQVGRVSKSRPGQQPLLPPWGQAHCLALSISSPSLATR